MTTKVFHEDSASDAITLQPQDVHSYHPFWSTMRGFRGTTIKLNSGKTLRVREQFREVHEWMDAAWGPLKKPAKPSK